MPVGKSSGVSKVPSQQPTAGTADATSSGTWNKGVINDVAYITSSIPTAANPDNIEKLSQTVLDEMNKIKTNGPTLEDLNKVKETLIRERETQVKENNFWLGYLKNHYLYGNKMLSLEEYKALVNSFTVKKIQAVANKYLNTSSYVKVALTPKEKAEVK